MNRLLLLRLKARLRDAVQPVSEAAVGGITIALLRITRLFDPDKTANFFGSAALFIGRSLRDDHIGDYDADHPEKPSRIEFSPRSKVLFDMLRDDGKPAIFFASHLGNWELPALGAVAHGLDAAILFRRPNIEAADRAIERTRAVKMGTLIPAGRDAPFKHGQALQNGQHIAMLVDQWFTNGVDVTFFGRKTKANPTLARLVRQVECPIHGVRIIRLPN